MQQRTISTMQPLTGATAGAAANLIISRLSVPVIQRIDGYMNGTDSSTQYWLMFFSGTAVPADTAVPLFELQLVGKNGFSWDFSAQGGLDFTKMLSLFTGALGLIAVISSTSATLTASVATMDIAVTVNEPFLLIAGQSVIGDLTTAVQALTVWSSATGPKKLIHIDAKNNVGGGTIQYLQLFAQSPTAADIPIMGWSLADAATLTLDFGQGFSPFLQIAGSPPTTKQGCFLAVSSTAATYTAAAGTPWTIRTFYK